MIAGSPSGNDLFTVVICGPPTSLTYFLADRVRDIIADWLGSCELHFCNEVVSENANNIVDAVNNSIFVSDMPRQSLIEFANHADIPIIVLSQNFTDCCMDFAKNRDTSLIDAIRAVSASKIGAWYMGEIPRSRIISQNDNDTLGLLDEILSPFPLSHSLSRSSQHVLDDALRRQHSADDPLALPAVRGMNLSAAIGALDAFYGGTDLSEAQIFRVPIASLSDATPPYIEVSGRVDLVGPARCLSFGPYLYLPRGQWQVTVVFESGDNDSTNTFLFDFTAASEIKFRYDFVIAKSGKFEFSRQFFIYDPWAPFEFRTFLKTGAIGGYFQIESLVIERISADQ